MTGMIGVLVCVWSAAGADLLTPVPLTARLEGHAGRYVDAIVDQWLLPAPDANPGMLEMMRLRDRAPDYEDPVPWAGEFVGKFLTSAVLMRRISDSAALDEMTRGLIAELVATQDADGYLGPFRKDKRLLGHWDLWGHYHAMLALHTWFAETGDEAALAAACRAADLVCATYLDTGRRVLDAGSAEMNMAVIHSLGLLHRETGKPEYLRMMRAIEEDWARPPAGDYLNAALAGTEFYQSPKPRWESLHPMLGLGELFRITGEAKYRDALLHWWRSIRTHDVHNSGSFSTNEQATGNPFMPGAIETCCTVAWIAYSVEALRLSADPAVADALELAFWNAVLGYEHPSGRWCTYDTPMNGKRLASAHSIVFQSRPGTPELNCCSVNGPRGLAMLSDWAVMRGADGLYLNYYGPGTFTVGAGGAEAWTFVQRGGYPADGGLEVEVRPDAPRRVALFLRIPGWSKETVVKVNGAAVPGVAAGAYLRVEREWKPGDVIAITFDMRPRALRGDAHVQWRTSLYRGPLLLAYDQKYNAFDPGDLPELDLDSLSLTPAEPPAGRFAPIVCCPAAAPDGRTLTLVDFATAGAHGTRYESWLPVRNAPPAPFYVTWPAPGARVAPEDLTVEWSPAAKEGAVYDVAVARDVERADVLWHAEGLEVPHAAPELGRDAAAGPVFLTVTARVGGVAIPAVGSPLRMVVEPALPSRMKGTVLDAPLRGAPDPETGAVLAAEHLSPAPGPDGAADGALRFDGKASKLVYDAPGFPTRNHTLSVWFRAESPDPANKGWQEIVSAWYQGGCDPLRLALTGGQLVVRIEHPMGTFQTPGVPVARGEWIHAAIVKRGAAIKLFVNGAEAASLAVPELLSTDAKILGVGCNPLHSELEGFHGDIARVQFHREAFGGENVKALAAAR